MKTRTRPAPAHHGDRPRGVRVAQPRWQRRKEERPSELLDAALEVFAERGYAATRLEDVARRAGVTKGTMYLYFANKEALFKELVRKTTLPVVEMVEELVRTHHGPARDLVDQILRRRWEAIVDSPLSGIPKLMMSEAGNFPELSRWYHDHVISRSNAALARAIELGIVAGEFRPTDPRRAAYLAVAPLLIAAMWKHSFSRCVTLPFDSSSYLEGHLEIFLRGLERRPGEESARV
jgi:AcrR family transcriptional regulator